MEKWKKQNKRRVIYIWDRALILVERAGFSRASESGHETTIALYFLILILYQFSYAKCNLCVLCCKDDLSSRCRHNLMEHTLTILRLSCIRFCLAELAHVFPRLVAP